jgi:hypothetical protein
MNSKKLLPLLLLPVIFLTGCDRGFHFRFRHSLNYCDTRSHYAPATFHLGGEHFLRNGFFHLDHACVLCLRPQGRR